MSDIPAWIVHTHFLAPSPMASWIRTEGLPTRQAVVVTDIHLHRIWISDDVDNYFVATNSAREVLIQRGVSPRRVRVTGIPIMAKHQRSVDCCATGAHFDWQKNKPVILVIAGSDFLIGPVGLLIERLLEQFPDVTIQVATGRNETLYRQLLSKCRRYHNLRAFTFTDRMNELISCATVVISKTGGITTSECLAHGSALVGFYPVPGQEERNADYLVTHGAGIKAKSLSQAIRAVGDLLKHNGLRITLRANARRLGRPQAASAVADYLLDSLASTTGVLPSCG